VHSTGAPGFNMVYLINLNGGIIANEPYYLAHEAMFPTCTTSYICARCIPTAVTIGPLMRTATGLLGLFVSGHGGVLLIRSWNKRSSLQQSGPHFRPHSLQPLQKTVIPHLTTSASSTIDAASRRDLRFVCNGKVQRRSPDTASDFSASPSPKEGLVRL